VDEVCFGLNKINWNGGSWVWTYWNGLEWQNLVGLTTKRSFKKVGEEPENHIREENRSS
jgi:hypothetical protein